jgi:hypothetical protein
MRMTRQELVEMARVEYLDDVKDPYLWSKEELSRYARQAEYEACRRTDRLIFDTTSTGIISMTVYATAPIQTLDSSIIQVKGVRYSTTVLGKKTATEMDRDITGWRTTTASAPTDYVIEGRGLTTYPIPTTSGSFALDLDVYRLPSGGMTSDSSYPEIPDEFHDDLVHWICYRAYMKRDTQTLNPKSAAESLALFERAFGPPVDARVRQHQLENPRSTKFRPASFDSKVDKRRDDSWTNW